MHSDLQKVLIPVSFECNYCVPNLMTFSETVAAQFTFSVRDHFWFVWIFVTNKVVGFIAHDESTCFECVLHGCSTT